jgi:5-methylcytosine-specific restriction endonuclease McrA
MRELSHVPGEVISYIEMCQAWSASLQRGMNFHIRPDCSLILMSRRSNAPYRDDVEEDGKVIVYEGHDVSRTSKNSDPKTIDQPRSTPGGRLTQKGQCVLCGSKDNLHFDHDLPYSKGGSSLSAANIRLLCARHNLSKGAKLR